MLTAKSAMISSGAFPKVALSRPPDPGTGVLRGMLRGLADQPRERDEGAAREHEQQDLVRICQLVDEDRGGREGKERPEDPA